MISLSLGVMFRYTFGSSPKGGSITVSSLGTMNKTEIALPMDGSETLGTPWTVPLNSPPVRIYKHYPVVKQTSSFNKYIWNYSPSPVTTLNPESAGFGMISPSEFQCMSWELPANMLESMCHGSQVISSNPSVLGL